jgi:ATP dependent DNA ligase domain
MVPMAPTLTRPPFHRDGWVYEEKVDGWRMLAYKDAHRIRLISRNAVDHTWRFAELATAIAKLTTDVVVLDGEVAVFDEKLVSRFHLLGDDTSGVISTPPVFIAFDVLQAGGHDLRNRPLVERRHFLEEIVDGADMVLPCRRLPEDGAEAWHMVEERGYEGFVAKDPRSTYRPGPTRAWVKVKVRHEGVFIVARSATSTPSTVYSLASVSATDSSTAAWSSGASTPRMSWNCSVRLGCSARQRRRSTICGRCAEQPGSSRVCAPKSPTQKSSAGGSVRRAGARCITDRWLLTPHTGDEWSEHALDAVGRPRSSRRYAM